MEVSEEDTSGWDRGSKRAGKRERQGTSSSPHPGGHPPRPLLRGAWAGGWVERVLLALEGPAIPRRPLAGVVVDVPGRSRDCSFSARVGIMQPRSVSEGVDYATSQGLNKQEQEAKRSRRTR